MMTIQDRSVTEGLENIHVARGIVQSLRTLLIMTEHEGRVTRAHLEQIAWAEDIGTKAFIELQTTE